MTQFSFSIDKAGLVLMTGTDISGGYVGDHNAIKLVFTVADGFCPDADYFRVHSENYMSEELYLENGTVTYSLPAALTTTDRLALQLKGYVINGGDVEVIAHSRMISVCLFDSLNSDTEVSHEALDRLETVTASSKAAASDAQAAAVAAQASAADARLWADGAESSANAASEYAQEAQNHIISSADINESGELVLVYVSGNTVNAGMVKGEKGDAPQRGTDYWTEEDIAAMQSYMDGLFNAEIATALEEEY